ncbi:hypothetical protein [Streptomyces sp. NPDC017673]|uniref:hypothetical protein n=1 Tax=unclassified Streptomyces TaxID=2593676 RepID=UPI00378B80E1
MREFLVEITTSVPDGTPAGRRRGAPRERILGTLPLRPWTQLTVTPLESRPNDPGRS